MKCANLKVVGTTMTNMAVQREDRRLLKAKALKLQQG